MTYPATLIALIVGLELYEALHILFVLIAAPAFGLIVYVVSFWGNIFTRNGGKWVSTRGRFSPMWQFGVQYDMNKPIPENNRSLILLFDTLTLLFQFLLTAAVFLIYRSVPENGFPVNWRSVMLWVFIEFILLCVLQVVVHIKTHFIKRKGLEGYIDDLFARFRRGEAFPDSMMRPVQELPFAGCSDKTKIRYYRFYIMHLLWTGQYDRLYLPVHETAAYLRNKAFLISDTGYYYDVVFYYSRFEYDPEQAHFFMDRIRSVLAADPDANAKRVLAYYAYGVENDKEKARLFTDQALAVADNFSLPGMERELERRLINELDERLAADGYVSRLQAIPQKET